MIDELQREADMERAKAFKEQFKIDAKQVAISQAKRDAANLSGLQKLRATNRANRMQTQEPTPGTFFGKLSEYTKKNLANREDNLKRTAQIRKVAEEEKQKKLGERISQRESRMVGRKTLGQSNWKQ